MDCLKQYLEEIDEQELLSAQQEQELAERVEQGDSEARDIFIRANLRLVVHIAKGYRNRGLPLQDLISEGTMGLMQAVERFDRSMNTRFSTYAAYWIKEGIQHALVYQADLVRIPAWVHEAISKMRQKASRIEQQTGQKATVEQVIEHLRHSDSEKTKLVYADAWETYQHRKTSSLSYKRTHSLERDPKDDEGFIDPPAAELFEGRFTEDDIEELYHALDMLEPPQQEVLRRYFGLNGDREPETLAGIGLELHMHRDTVRKIKTQALEALQELLTSQGQKRAS